MASGMFTEDMSGMYLATISPRAHLFLSGSSMTVALPVMTAHLYSVFTSQGVSPSTRRPFMSYTVRETAGLAPRLSNFWPLGRPWK